MVLIVGFFLLCVMIKGFVKLVRVFVCFVREFYFLEVGFFKNLIRISKRFEGSELVYLLYICILRKCENCVEFIIGICCVELFYFFS